jgi:hypothetical protein
MKRISKIEYNKKTENMEEKFITEHGNIITYGYPTCSIINCKFYSTNNKAGIKAVIEHTKTCTAWKK